MKLFKEDNLLEFTERFKTEEDCRQYLIDLKWSNGFKCPKCGCKKTERSKTWYYKRCKECKYDESVTANTLFHKIKFPLLKAFHILFRLSTSKKGSSSVQLSRDFGVNQKTAWLFRQKAQVAMKSSQNYKLTGTVHVDEFVVGGPEAGAQGRSDGEKGKVIIGIEVIEKNRKKSIGRAYAKVIADYSKGSFKGFFETFIDKSSKVKSDGFSTYTSLKDEYNIDQFYSNKGLNFPEIHTIIMNMKSWLRGIHHSCDNFYLQKYLDEFMFRFNRRTRIKSIFSTLVNRLIESDPWPLKRINELNG